MRIGLVIVSAMLAVSCDAPQEQTSDQIEATGDTYANGAADQMSVSAGSQSEPVTAATFAALAANTDLFEIEAGKLAIRKGQSAATREFGEMMVADHTASSRELKAAVEKSSLSIVLPTRLDARHQGQLDRLAQADAKDFDRQYMNLQLDGHRGALKMHQEYQMVADNGELLTFSQKVLPVIQGHFDRLEKTTAAESRAMTGSVTQ